MKNSHSILLEHYNKSFRQKPALSLTAGPEAGQCPIETLVYRPTKANDFWKLCTIGASDHEMPERDIGLGREASRRNEYVMFVDPRMEISRRRTEWLALHSILQLVAQYTAQCSRNVTVSDTLEFTDDFGHRRCAVLLLPEAMKRPDLVKCYTSKNKFITIYQVMPITARQLDEKLRRQDGTYWLMEQFYTHDDEYNLIGMKSFAGTEMLEERSS